MPTKPSTVQHSKNNLVNGTNATSSHNNQINKTAFVPTELLDNQTDGLPSSSGVKIRQEDDLLGLFASSSASASNGPSTSSSFGMKNELTEIAELFDFGSSVQETIAEKKSPTEAPNGLRTLKWDQSSVENEENKVPAPSRIFSGCKSFLAPEVVDPYAALRLVDATKISVGFILSAQVIDL